MRIHSSLLLVLSFGVVPASAQMVDIPDTDLQAFLQAECGCVVGGQIDASTWVPISLEFSTDIAQDGVLDLAGLEQLEIPGLNVAYGVAPLETVLMPGFPLGLQSLNLDPMILGQFPDVSTLPATVTSFGCFNCGLTGALDFQGPLEYIIINYCDLSSITVPPTVTQLFIDHNQLPACPALPLVLMHANLGFNDILALPALPSTLQTLDADQNQIADLPALPAGLTELNVEGNPITQLPALPPGLTSLRLSGTLLSDPLPALPAGLVLLTVSQLNSDILPTVLPASLTGLMAAETPISDLPALPSALISLDVSYCPAMECLPILPNALQNLWVEGSAVDCLPNMPTAMIYVPNINGAPAVVCNPGNTPCPLLQPLVTGTVFNDADSDGVMDVDDTPRPNAVVRGSTANSITASGADGRYVLPASVGSTTVNGQPLLYATITTPAYPVIFTSVDQVDSLNHIGYHVIPGMYDLVVTAMAAAPIRPGFESDCWFTVKNVGTETTAAQVSFTLDPQLAWVQAEPPPTSLLGGTGTWTIAQLLPGEMMAFAVVCHADELVPLGTPVQLFASATPDQPDQTPLDNFKLIGDLVVGSYDPNDKLVTPLTMTPAEVQALTPATYTVRFQNTGTFPAERVVIVDSIAADLRRPSFRFLGSSHPCTWYMKQNVVYFVFEGINLPDSGSNEAASHGFVQFNLEPQSTLIIGDEVVNEAYIYFDYNLPILTNEAIFTVDASTAAGAMDAGALRTWPNPVQEVLYMESAVGRTVEVIDVTGRMLLRERSEGAVHALDVRALVPGEYGLRMDGVGTSRFIKR